MDAKKTLGAKDGTAQDILLRGVAWIILIFLLYIVQNSGNGFTEAIVVALAIKIWWPMPSEEKRIAKAEAELERRAEEVEFLKRRAKNAGEKKS